MCGQYKIGNIIWWDPYNRCFYSDKKAEALIGSPLIAIKGISSTSMVSYILGDQKIFKYNKTELGAEGTVDDVTGNLDFSLFSEPSIQSNENGKIFIYGTFSGLTFWMDENSPGIW